jgi:hypothetical protein
MAVFRVPRITTAQRERLVLLESEVVFDTDLKKYFGGDSTTTGGFLLGSGASLTNFERIPLTIQNVNNKFVTLASIPYMPDKVVLSIEKGIKQINGIDFEVEGNKIKWEGLGLDNFLDDTDVLLVQY